MLDQALDFAFAAELFVCGVDFLYDKSRQSWFFIEANASPSFGLHKSPSEGEAVNAAMLVVTDVLSVYDHER